MHNNAHTEDVFPFGSLGIAVRPILRIGARRVYHGESDLCKQKDIEAWIPYQLDYSEAQSH